jgi:hypothetical protein
MSMEKLWNRPLYKIIYHRHMGYVEKSDCMSDYYSISRWTWEWTKKLFFHLLDLTILNSITILTSCGSKLSHQQFKLTLVRDLIQEAGRVPQPQTARQRWQAPSMSQLKRFDLRHTRHWLMYCKRIWCHVFYWKQRNKNKIQVSRRQHKSLCYPTFQTAFLRTKWLVTRKSRTHKCKQILPL